MSQRRTRFAGGWMLALAVILLSACGDETAPLGATVSAPGDAEFTYNFPSASFYDQTAAPLQFQVLDAAGNPVPGVKIRFFGGSQTVALTTRGIPDPLAATYTPLNSSDPAFFETTTDDRGLSPTDIYPTFVVVGCGISTSDIDTTATVTASVGNASATWTLSITSKCT